MTEMTAASGTASTFARRRSSAGSQTLSIKPSKRDLEQIQIIDFDGNFAADFDKHMHRLALDQCGFNFNVVTVLGCQSSGKSTLLNSMFGTHFPEMNSLEGRSQTTKGIWVAKDQASPTLVIDVEGTDSKERGEDRLTFEHRASLFSLAIADAVIVNMWYHDIGRYAASNYGLLKTVLAVNLELFQQEKDCKRTTMIFVIRDWSPSITPLHLLQKMLMADLDEIWSDIKKPADFRDSKLIDFFKFVVFGMPSKIMDKGEYERGVRDLKRLWQLEEAPAEYSRNVPADGFALYAKQVWLAILSSSELNIPSQKEMVATYRCEEIRQSVLKTVVPRITEHVDNPIKLFDDKIAEAVVVDAINAYHKDAWRYQENVYCQKRDALLEALYNEIQKPLEKFLFATRQRLAKEKSKQLEAKCRKDPWDETKMEDGTGCIDFWMNLNPMTSQWKSEVLAEFDAICREASIKCTVDIEAQPEPLKFEINHAFDVDLIRRSLIETLDEAIQKVLTKEQQFFKKFIDEKVDAIRPEVESLYLQPEFKPDAFWTEVTTICDTAANSFDQEFGTVLDGMTSKDDDTTHAAWNTRDRLAAFIVRSLRDIIVQRMDFFPDQIHKRFCVFFEADEKGAPYYWASLSQERIRDIYVAAREKAEVLLPALSAFNVSLSKVVKNAEVSDQEEKSVQAPILSESKKLEIQNIAAKRMLKSCQEAQFIQATGGRMSKPGLWWWIILLVFAQNEIMWILRSPIFFMALVTVACILGASWYTGNMYMLMHFGRSAWSLALGILIPTLTRLQDNGAGGAREIHVSSEPQTLVPN